MSGTGVGIWRIHGRSMGLGVADVNAMSSHLEFLTLGRGLHTSLLIDMTSGRSLGFPPI
jgi:hypothetical protein